MTKPCPPSYSATLLVLTERELVAIDLTQPDWPVYDSPYLNCMDFTPVTAITHIGQVCFDILLLSRFFQYILVVCRLTYF